MPSAGLPGPAETPGDILRFLMLRRADEAGQFRNLAGPVVEIILILSRSSRATRLPGHHELFYLASRRGLSK
jgi:hypothetical protein